MKKQVSCPHCGSRNVEVGRAKTAGSLPVCVCRECGESSRELAGKLGPDGTVNYKVGLAMLVGFFTALICYLLAA
jgi:uncharacterized Zn finger protein